MFEVIPFATWATFVIASSVLIVIPGPVVTYVIACSITHGTRTGLAGVVGTTIGTGVLLAACGLGLVPLFVTLADWFDVIRFMGAAYLVWLGVQQWRAAPAPMSPAIAEDARRNRRTFLAQGFLIAITNPKSILFFAAFLPQFMDPARPAGMQIIALSLTFMVLGAVLDGLWALLGGRVRHLFQNTARVRSRNRIAGGFLILTGLGLALARRSN